MEIVYNATVVGGQSVEDSLTAIEIAHASSGTTDVVPAAGLFVLIGSSPHTGVARGNRPAGRSRDSSLVGADVDRAVLADPERTPLPLETSVPGVFAVGDVRRGSIKRVATAVGDGAAVVEVIHGYLAAAPVPIRTGV